ncbi:MAG TPA: hypothetical protein VMK42_14810 [Anaeromyxobacteraceae bacterium]|nr:hypothetical protein [Anaeromyxobacteraceae bacterium]
MPSRQAFPMPEGLTFESGAALLVNYLTAYHVLFRLGHLRPEQALLVHGAGGGVGMAVLELARTVPGVTVLGTASEAKHAAIGEAGCHHPIDPRAQDYASEVRRVTGGRGWTWSSTRSGARTGARGTRSRAPPACS